MSGRRTGKAQYVAFLGMLFALVIVLSFLEAMITPALGLPPGVKPGLANIAVFYSTALYVMGRDEALKAMQNGVQAILLDESGTLYVSESFRDSLELLMEDYQVVYVK